MAYNPFAKNAAPRGIPNQNQANSGGGRGFNNNRPQQHQPVNKNPFATQNPGGQPQNANQRQVTMNQQGGQGFNNRQQQSQQQQIRFQDNQPSRNVQSHDNRGGFQNKSSGGQFSGSGGKGNPFASAGSQNQVQPQQHKSGVGNPFAQHGGQQTGQMDMGSSGFSQPGGGVHFQQQRYNQQQSQQQQHHQQNAVVKTNVNPFQQGFQATTPMSPAPMSTGGSVFGFQGGVNAAPSQFAPSSSQFGQQQNRFQSNSQSTFGSTAGKNPFSGGGSGNMSEATSGGFNSFANRNNQAPKMQFTQQDLKELDVSSVLGTAGGANKVQGIELNLDGLVDENAGTSAIGALAAGGTATTAAAEASAVAAESSEDDKVAKALQERSAQWDAIMKSSVFGSVSEEPPAASPYELMMKDSKTGKPVIVAGRIPLLPPSSFVSQ